MRAADTIPTTSLGAELLQAFHDTHYRVCLPGATFTARIGQVSPEVSILLTTLHAETAVFLTAANPFSADISDAENAERNALLANTALAAGTVVIPATGSAPNGNWQEPSFLLIGLSRAQATEWADRYEQNAYVWLEIGKPVELVLRR